MQTSENATGLVGRHRFVAYEGDVELVETDAGLLVPANPVVHDSGWINNLITSAGKNLLLDRLAGIGGAAAITHLGVGDNATAPSVDDTQLASASAALKALDAAPTRAGQALTFKATFGTGEANFNWQEAGLFNGPTDGTSTMFNRALIGPFNKTSNVSIAYTVTVTQA